MPDPYCPLCGNTGIDINGDICKCQLDKVSFFTNVTCMEVPAQYMGIAFSSALVPSDLGDAYKNMLQSLYDRIVTQKLRYMNTVICSPARHSKTIFVYSCIQRLFASGVPVFPFLDITEIQRLMNDIDCCRSPTFEIQNPDGMYTVPYLFVRIPAVISYDTYNYMSMLLDRRVRRGGSTIFVYNGTWNNLVSMDKRGTLRYLQGDGSGTSIKVSSWFRQEAMNEKETEQT